jgi:FkbM family methyltransferase
MIKEIKNTIKRMPWWYIISDNEVYQRMTNAKLFNSFLRDITFYKSLVGTSNNLIFDVGANVGTKSKIFSLLAKKVILFEPDLNNCRILNARLKHNDNCTIACCALSDHQGVAKYYSIGNDSAYNSLSEKHINTVVLPRGILIETNDLEEYNVSTYTLDYFINKYGLPDYIKIDVEGFERQVILGLTNLAPLISIEANLPQFLPETIDIVNYLDHLSKGKYLFNYTINSRFELSEPLYSNAIIEKLSALKVKTVEVYCILDLN